jgi:hypothetical protein
MNTTLPLAPRHGKASGLPWERGHPGRLVRGRLEACAPSGRRLDTVSPGPSPDRGRASGRAGGARIGLLIVAASLLAAATGCSPEDGRTRGGGLGADVGNTALPIQMHGNRERNNPSARVPDVGRVPRDARGVPGWWAQ